MTLPRPIQNKIMAELLPEQESTKSGIILGNANLDKHRCKVLAVGPKVDLIQVGDILRFNANSAQTAPFNNKEYLFLREDEDVLFVM